MFPKEFESLVNYSSRRNKTIKFPIIILKRKHLFVTKSLLRLCQGPVPKIYQPEEHIVKVFVNLCFYPPQSSI